MQRLSRRSQLPSGDWQLSAKAQRPQSRRSGPRRGPRRQLGGRRAWRGDRGLGAESRAVGLTAAPARADARLPPVRPPHAWLITLCSSSPCRSKTPVDASKIQCRLACRKQPGERAHIRRAASAGLAPTPFPFLENAIKAGRALDRRLRAGRPGLPSRAASPRLPACPARPLPPLTCPAAPPGAVARDPGPGTHLARELCVLFRLLFPVSSQPAASSRELARWAVRGSPKALGEDAHHMAARSQPPTVPGRGRGRVEGRPERKQEPGGRGNRQAGWRGRRRALTLARLRPQPGCARSLLLLLLRRRRLGAVCSAPRGSRSPRNAHTLNRYIVDIRRWRHPLPIHNNFTGAGQRTSPAAGAPYAWRLA